MPKNKHTTSTFFIQRKTAFFSKKPQENVNSTEIYSTERRRIWMMSLWPHYSKYSRFEHCSLMNSSELLVQVVLRFEGYPEGVFRGSVKLNDLSSQITWNESATKRFKDCFISSLCEDDILITVDGSSVMMKVIFVMKTEVKSPAGGGTHIALESSPSSLDISVMSNVCLHSMNPGEAVELIVDESCRLQNNFRKKMKMLFQECHQQKKLLMKCKTELKLMADTKQANEDMNLLKFQVLLNSKKNKCRELRNQLMSGRKEWPEAPVFTAEREELGTPLGIPISQVLKKPISTPLRGEGGVCASFSSTAATSTISPRIKRSKTSLHRSFPLSNKTAAASVGLLSSSSSVHSSSSMQLMSSEIKPSLKERRRSPESSSAHTPVRADVIYEEAEDVPVISQPHMIDLAMKFISVKEELSEGEGGGSERRESGEGWIDRGEETGEEAGEDTFENEESGFFGSTVQRFSGDLHATSFEKISCKEGKIIHTHVDSDAMQSSPGMTQKLSKILGFSSEEDD